MILHQWKGLSGSALKIIALVSMTVNHIVYYLMEHGNWTYDMMWMVGRVAFPIFAFPLVEEYDHIRSTRKHVPGFLAFALIFEIPWWLLSHGSPYSMLFTLLLGLIAIEGMSKIDSKPLLWCILMIIICTITTFLHTDYEYPDVLLIRAFYISQPNKMVKCPLATLSMYQYGVASLWLSLVTIHCHNRQKGFIKGQCAKCLYYTYYPLYYTTLLLYANFSR